MSADLEPDAAWEGSGLGFLYRQFFARPRPVPPSVNLRDKTVLVTGANGGLGREALRQLLQLQASRAIVAVRNRVKGEAAAVQLRREFPHAQIDVMLVIWSRTRPSGPLPANAGNWTGSTS